MQMQLGSRLGVGMSTSMHAWIWVVFSFLSACFRPHCASSSLADTICISMKWNLVPLSVPDSWQFRPGQHRSKITSRQTDYLYRRLLPSLSHDSTKKLQSLGLKCEHTVLWVCMQSNLVLRGFFTLKEKMVSSFIQITFNMICFPSHLEKISSKATS